MQTYDYIVVGAGSAGCGIARQPAAIDLHVGKRAHCIAVALVDLETECRGDLCLVGRYIGALMAQPVQFERRRDMTLLRGLAVPARRGPQVARYAITALQQPRACIATRDRQRVPPSTLYRPLARSGNRGSSCTANLAAAATRRLHSPAHNPHRGQRRRS
jgi:hypothetical protein